MCLVGSIDPRNTKVRDAIERLEKNDLGMDSTYDVEVEDMEGTDVEVGATNR